MWPGAASVSGINYMRAVKRGRRKTGKGNCKRGGRGGRKGTRRKAKTKTNAEGAKEERKGRRGRQRQQQRGGRKNNAEGDGGTRWFCTRNDFL